MTGERFARISERAVRCREMSASDWRVFACISLHADASGRAWPSMNVIAEITGVRAQDVPRTIRRLMRLVGLQCERGGGRGRRNVYVIPLGDREPENVRNGADVKAGENVRNGADVKEPKHPHPCVGHINRPKNKPIIYAPMTMRAPTGLHGSCASTLTVAIKHPLRKRPGRNS